MSHSINLFFFKKYFKSNVVIKDVVSLKTTSCVRFGGGSAHKAALSTGLTESLRCQNFVRLHDVVLYHSDLYINCRKYVDKERFVVGVKRSRRRAPLANKFTIHGLKERALKYYAKALSFYYIMVRESLTAHDFMLHGVINEFIFFKKYIKRVGKFIRPRLYTKKRFLNRSSSQLSSTGLFINLENTEFIYKQLRRNTPPYALDISRVSKQVYKSTRGKSGRYVLR